MLGYLEVEQLATAVADQDTNVKGLEAKGLDHEQIGRPDGVGVIGQEGMPALAGWARSSAPAVAPNGAGTDRDGDQLPDLVAQARSTQSRAGAPPPIEPPTPAMPADDGLRPDEDEMLSPIPMESAGDQSEELVPGVEPRAALGSESDMELLAQEEILEKEIVMTADGSRKGGEQNPEEGQHRTRIAALEVARRPCAVLPPYAGSNSLSSIEY